jgi:hypothetical protein
MMNDPMEATFIGFRMWALAVIQAGTTAVDAVRQAMYGQRIKAPSGFACALGADRHGVLLTEHCDGEGNAGKHNSHARSGERKHQPEPIRHNRQ